VLDASHVPFTHHSVQGNCNRVPDLNLARVQYGQQVVELTCLGTRGHLQGLV
jgi:hypothetical protein